MILGLGNLAKNCVIKFPVGTWGFVGSVDVRLGHTLDGDIIETDEQAQQAMELHERETILCMSPKKRRVKTRQYPTKQAAIDAAIALDAEFND